MRAADTACCLEDVFSVVLRCLLQTLRTSGNVVPLAVSNPNSSCDSSKSKPPAEKPGPPTEMQAGPSLLTVGGFLGKIRCPPALPSGAYSGSQASKRLWLDSALAGILIKVVERRRV